MSDSARPHRRQPTRLPIPGTLQARTLEWVAISFFGGSSWSRDRTLVSYIGRQILYCWATRGRELLKLIKFKLINLHLLRAGGEGGDRGEGWIASPTQWTWVWGNSERKERVRHDLVTEQQQDLIFALLIWKLWDSASYSPLLKAVWNTYTHFSYKETKEGTPLVVQWLGLHAFSARGSGSIPGWGFKISQARLVWKKKKSKDKGCDVSFVLLAFFLKISNFQKSCKKHTVNAVIIHWESLPTSASFPSVQKHT